MARIAIFVLLGAACGHGDKPATGHAARTMPCKRGAVELSETFEDTWRGEDGVMRLRYTVSASCHASSKEASQARLDYWRDCRWGDDDWACEDWKSGTAPAVHKATPDWIDKGSRGR
jgi:hypothetical protein